MFGGEVVKARLRFDNSLISTVLDRFGVHTALYQNGDCFEINADVAESPVFLGWIAQFGCKAEIVSPAVCGRQ